MKRMAPLGWVLVLMSLACTAAPATAPKPTAAGPTGVLTSLTPLKYA